MPNNSPTRRDIRNRQKRREPSPLLKDNYHPLGRGMQTRRQLALQRVAVDISGTHYNFRKWYNQF